MKDKAIASNVILRPHFKTHQSVVIGNWFRKAGIHPITVSTVSMAKYFANYGWKDITISIPVNILELYDLNELAREVKLNIVAESAESMEYIDKHLTYNVGVYIKVDTGYNRSGVWWKDLKLLTEVFDFLKNAKKLNLQGLLTHSGHTYQVESKTEIIEIFNDTVLKMNYVREHFQDDWPELKISIGDTPSCSLVQKFNGVDEIRPGNFIFYDLMQYSIGACSIDQVAMAVACPVIAKSPQRNEIVIYGGAVHLSKDFLFKSNGERIYGYVVLLEENKWTRPIKGTYVSKLTQDHGVITTTKEFFDQVKRGDILGILPIHSCLTANLMKKYTTLDGERIDY
jgi:D-serine deaminase-like pyridoxal phosphate-dependent protein